MKAKKSVASRVVRIQRDPNEAKYIAKDTTSGLTLMWHHDTARLREMCGRIGWQVVDAPLQHDHSGDGNQG